VSGGAPVLGDLPIHTLVSYYAYFGLVMGTCTFGSCYAYFGLVIGTRTFGSCCAYFGLVMGIYTLLVLLCMF